MGILRSRKEPFVLRPRLLDSFTLPPFDPDSHSSKIRAGKQDIERLQCRGRGEIRNGQYEFIEHIRHSAKDSPNRSERFQSAQCYALVLSGSFDNAAIPSATTAPLRETFSRMMVRCFRWLKCHEFSIFEFTECTWEILGSAYAPTVSWTRRIPSLVLRRCFPTSALRPLEVAGVILRMLLERS